MRKLIIACVVLSASIAVADDRTKAVDAMLAAQTKALIADDDAAFDATMTADGQRTFSANDFSANSLWGYPKPQKMKVTQRRIGWAGTWGWVAAEMRVTGTMYAEPEGAGDPNPQPETGVYRWIAIIELDGAVMKTKLLIVLGTEVRGNESDQDYVQRLIANPKPPELVALLANPTALATRIANEPNAVVFGSQTNEVGLGAAAAKKLLASWKKIVFEVADTDGTDRFVKKSTYVPVEKTVGDVSFARAHVRYMNTKTKRWNAMDAILFARKTTDGWQPIIAAYSPD